MPQSPTELTDLEVDRVDAVDRPATRRKFLIVKAEGDAAPDPVAEAKRLLSAAATAVGKIHASKADYEDVTLVDALNELAQAAGASERFAKSAAAPATAAAAPAAAATTPPADAAAAPAAPVVPAVAPALDMAAFAAAVGESVVKALKADIAKDEDDVGTADTIPVTAPASAQPEPVAVSKGAKRDLGDGIFTNIIFGRNN